MRRKILFIIPLVAAALLALAAAGLNLLIDPYGAFGDPLLHWWSYNETKNPKVAKMTYLKEHYDEYDSYIIGSSGSSSYPVEKLNEYLDASFYNCFFYGVDMKDYEAECLYILDHYPTRYIVLALCPDVAYSYGVENKGLTGMEYYAVSGRNPLTFYSHYLFADPREAWEKLRLYRQDDYVVQQPYRVFDEKTGSYDKSRRDAEPIGDVEKYLERSAYVEFLNYPSETRSMPYLSDAIESVQTIRDACRAKGVELIVLCNPTYYEAAEYYSEEDMARFRNALASVTDYWDFTLSPVSYDPRFFYDLSHFRNCVGEMALARVFGDESVYYPVGFGEYVPEGATAGAPRAQAIPQEEYIREIPILLYHHLTEVGEVNESIVTTAAFGEQMRTLYESGWATISLRQLQGYVQEGAELPEKCFVLTFDDGYESSLTLACPILQSFGFRAAIFPIGVSMGKDTYKETGVAMIPHFSVAQSREMLASGVIELGSHGYDVHEVAGRDEEPIRIGALPKADETETEYALFMHEDCAKMRGLIGMDTPAFAYPYGKCSILTEIVLRNEGVRVTLTMEPKLNTVIKGMPQSLLQLGRMNVTDDMSGEDILALFEGE